MKLIANVISALFHPLLMVTYGVLISLGFTYLAVYPLTVKLFLLAGIFLTTAVLPGILVFVIELQVMIIIITFALNNITEYGLYHIHTRFNEQY